MTENIFDITATTLYGLEDLLAEELAALGAQSLHQQRRLVTFTGNRDLLYRANLWSRLAIRVLMPVHKFVARDESILYREVQKIDWSGYLRARGTLAVDAVVHNSSFTHSLYVAQLTKDAIVDQFRNATGIRPSVDLDDPDVRVHLHINENRATLSLDSSGDSLHKRGYRLKTNTVPVNEVLAAGIIRHSGWDGKSSFSGPMCGSGTFVIEAAMMAIRRAPGYARKFGFMRWLDYDENLFRKLHAEALAGEMSHAPCPIVGSDVNKKSVQIARENVQNAGLAHVVRIERRALEDESPPPPPGVMIVNPPYGVRQEEENLAARYKMIGDVLKQKYQGYIACVFTGNREAAKHIGLRPSRRIELYNGPIDCRLLRFEIYAGSRK